MWWNLRVMMIWLPRSWKRKYASKSDLLKKKYEWFFEYLALSFSLKACDIWSGVFSLILGFPWSSVGKASACNVGSSVQLSSVQSLSHVWLFVTPWIAACHPCPSPTPRVYSNPCPSSWWCHPAILSSVVPFSSCRQSLPASGSFPRSQFFASGGQSIGVSASASVLPMNTQDRSPLGWTGWISLQSKGLSRVFSNTTVQKHQFFGAQLSSQS